MRRGNRSRKGWPTLADRETIGEVIYWVGMLGTAAGWLLTHPGDFVGATLMPFVMAFPLLILLDRWICRSSDVPQSPADTSQKEQS